MGFAAGGEAGVEGDERLVPVEGGGEGCGVKGAADAGASAGDVSLALVGAAVGVEGGETGEGGDLLAADLAELWQADDEGDGGALADAGDAENELEAPSEVVMGAQPLCDAAQLGPPPRLQADDIVEQETALARIVDVLEADLQAGDVVLGLLAKVSRSARRESPEISGGSRVAAQAAIRAASRASFFARRRRTLA